MQPRPVPLLYKMVLALFLLFRPEIDTHLLCFRKKKERKNPINNCSQTSSITHKHSSNHTHKYSSFTHKHSSITSKHNSFTHQHTSITKQTQRSLTNETVLLAQQLWYGMDKLRSGKELQGPVITSWQCGSRERRPEWCWEERVCEAQVVSVRPRSAGTTHRSVLDKYLWTRMKRLCGCGVSWPSLAARALLFTGANQLSRMTNLYKNKNKN